jgi:hypothetical protein
VDRLFNDYKQQVMGAAPFKGDSLELLRAVYRGDYLATRDQIYAAGQCLRFERPPVITGDGRTVDQIREEVRAEFCRDDPRDALVEAILRHAEVARKKYEPPPEVTPPEPAPARHAPRPPEIDGGSVQQACDTEEKPKQSQPVTPRYADTYSATRDSPPHPERANGEPAAESRGAPLVREEAAPPSPNTANSALAAEPVYPIFGDPGVADDAPVMVPTRGSGGRIKWIARQ